MKPSFKITKHANSMFFVQVSSVNYYITGLDTLHSLMHDREFKDLKLGINLKECGGFYEFKCTSEILELVVDILPEEDYNLCLLESILKEIKL